MGMERASRRTLERRVPDERVWYPRKWWDTHVVSGPVETIRFFDSRGNAPRNYLKSFAYEHTLEAAPFDARIDSIRVVTDYNLREGILTVSSPESGLTFASLPLWNDGELREPIVLMAGMRIVVTLRLTIDPAEIRGLPSFDKADPDLTNRIDADEFCARRLPDGSLIRCLIEGGAAYGRG